MSLEHSQQTPSDAPHHVLLLSKLRPPRLSTRLIERPALLDLLDQALACPLTLLSAPAGFGKTTICQQWLDTRQRQKDFPPVAWLSLDEGDNNPPRFWSYFAAASQAFQPQLTSLSPFQIAHDTRPVGSSALQQRISAFINEITQLDCQGMLILEDYHVIHEKQIHQTLTFLIDQLPPGLHILLITRTDPPFSLARLRANHQLLEIHAPQLALSRMETCCFLQQSLPFELPEEIVTQIEEQMEGWVAGLRLFTLGFQGCTTPTEVQQLLSSFSGRHRYLLDYFLSEVLNTQEAAVQTFLLQTSHLQRLSASLCDSITGGHTSAQTLAEIERAGLFLQAIEDSEGWYRYHTLFAEAMQKEAVLRLGAAQIALCLQYTQTWYIDNGMVDKAIETALQRRAYLDVLALLEQQLDNPDMWREHTYGLTYWLQAVPEKLLATSPALCLAYAAALTFSSDSDRLVASTYTRVMTLLQYAEAQWQASQKRELLAQVLALRAMIATRQSDISGAALLARQALSDLTSQQSTWRVICQTVLAIEARSQGHFLAAYQAMLSGLATFRDAQRREGAVVLLVFLGELCLEQGALTRAEEFFQMVLQQARAYSNDQARALIGMAQLAYERNQLVQAEQQAQQVLSISTTSRDDLLRGQAIVLLARIAAARDLVPEAIKTLQARLAHLAPAQFPQQHREVQLWLMRFELAAGDTVPVQRWLDSPDALDLSAISRTQQEQQALLRARWLLQNGAADDALTLLRPWQEEAAANAHLRGTLEIGLLLSTAYHRLRLHKQERAQISETLQFAHADHYLRVFLDEGKGVSPLLAAQLAATQEKELQTYVRLILRAFDARQEQARAQISHEASPLALLSPQELQVLRLLADGLERQEIAERLVISLNTVKTHLQRLYQKLHVSNRFEAVELARRSNLTN